MKKLLALLVPLALMAGVVFVPPAFAAVTHFAPQSLSDLSNKTVGIQTGTLYEEYLQEKAPDAIIEFFADPNTMILALEQGKIDAFVTEGNTLPIEQRYHPSLVRMEEAIDHVYAGFVFGATERAKTICNQINEFIAQCESDGTKAQMEDYWLLNYDPDTCDVDRSEITGENGVLCCALESGYEPFAYMSNGQWCGYEVDFVYRFARAYGYQPEFIGLVFDALAPAVVSGKADFAAAVLSDERAEEALFSSPYVDYDIVVVYCDDSKIQETGFFSSIASSFQKTFLKEGRWQLFGSGALTTLIITIMSILIGTILGYLLYVVCKDGNRFVNRLVSAFGWFFHGIPAVVFLMILAYVVFAQSTLDNVIVSIVGFSLIFCFSTYDMIRSGVRAVGIGQYEAARAQGFSANQAFLLIQNPQAIFHFLPTFKSEVVALLKETSIVGYIAVQDLTKMSDIVRSRTYEAFFPLITTAIIYFIIIAILIWLINRINPLVDTTKRDVRKSLKDIDISKYDL